MTIGGPESSQGRGGVCDASVGEYDDRQKDDVFAGTGIGARGIVILKQSISVIERPSRA